MTALRAAFMPARLLDHYQSALADRDLLSLKANVALLEALLVARLSCLDVASNEQWDAGCKAYRDLANCQEFRELEKDLPKEARKAFAELAKNLDLGSNSAKAEHEVRELMQEQMRHADLESRRTFQGQEKLTADEAHGFATDLLQIIQTHVQNGEVRSRISQDIEGILGHHFGSGPPVGI